MPIKKALEDFQYDPENFDFDAFRKKMLEEYSGDETAWRAAVDTRDATITDTSDKLRKAQAAAWELSQNQPVREDSTTGGEPDENSMDAIRGRVFKTVERT